MLTETYNHYYYNIWCKEAIDDSGLLWKQFFSRTFLYVLLYKYIRLMHCFTSLLPTPIV